MAFVCARAVVGEYVRRNPSDTLPNCGPTPGSVHLMGGSRRIPSATFRASDFKANEALDAFLAFVGGTMIVNPADTDNPALTDIEGSMTQLGPVVVGETFTRSILRGCRTDVHRKVLPDVLGVRVYLSGGDVGCVNDTCLKLRPGSVHIFPAEHVVLCQDQAHFVTCYMPFGVVGYDPSEHPPHFALSHTTPLGRILTSLIEAALKEVRTGCPTEAHTLGHAISAVVRTIIQRGRCDEELTPTLVEQRAKAMRDFVERIPALEHVSVERVCRAFNVSRAVAYRVFEADGGIQTFVRNRRLSGAYHDLLKSGATVHSVADIGRRWGFDDPSHFSRTFRKLYGISPRDVRYIAEFSRFDSTAKMEEFDLPKTLSTPLLRLWTPMAA